MGFALMQYLMASSGLFLHFLVFPLMITIDKLLEKFLQVILN